MKKLLILLNAVSLTATTASSVISCGGGKVKPVNQEPPVQQKDQPTITSKEEINKEKQIKINYFNELNNKIQKNRIEVANKIQLLESKNKDLEKQQKFIKNEIKELEQKIEQLNNQKIENASKVVELAYEKKIKIAENIKNNKILELITKQFDENENEIQQLKTQQDQEKFYISEINSISLPSKIIIPTTQQNKNKIYAMEKDIKKIVLKELQMKINNNLKECDFIIEFERKYINHNGTVAIELSHPKTIKIKIHGTNNTVGETEWISINLPKATVV